MAKARELTIREVNKIGLRVLLDALGPTDFVRFLRQYAGGSGDYTKDRRKILANVTSEELETGLKKVRQEILQDPVMAAKVFMSTGRGRGDYTKERHEWLDKIPPDEFAQAVFRRQRARKRAMKATKKG
jgi:hypothetical protein